ncbi:DUF3325 domain-containing protein [Delftia tsuruhatensis]|jgi:hypothetical protein|uniref:DUF3325 domain-containing protein n=1 Tax=Delftia TaxID=80865 RepID=UPI000315D8BC|nr:MULTISPECIES: DUF3325 domain-containing protein [Delftia]MDH0419422.1 DUF3325 domain-containing protein [Delftia tsuruhatensis]MDH0773679.1 DUF3325 domain-containing protein [Delftia tsuruhatensis]MDH1461427.1 DUF3325 domain-containing protein [Delftia tsuruhatensis]MDH1822279.1 DUF3325 domain-containing protein [Delftia tsuruhatensis]MPT51354.1 DUF3325 domain-containing protein [Delftia sp.]
MSMAHLFCQLLALGAFACLALAMDRHQSDLFGKELPSAHTRRLRAAGWVLLALSLWAALQVEPWSLGLVAWFGHISAAAAIVLLSMVARERLR